MLTLASSREIDTIFCMVVSSVTPILPTVLKIAAYIPTAVTFAPTDSKSKT